jgi:peptide-methionine (S)-S-oxide reductase
MHQFVKIIFILVLSLTTQFVTIFSSLQLNAEAKDSIILAGGCFWCVEADFEKVNGISEVISGYTGGYVTNRS